MHLEKLPFAAFSYFLFINWDSFLRMDLLLQGLFLFADLIQGIPVTRDGRAVVVSVP